MAAEANLMRAFSRRSLLRAGSVAFPIHALLGRLRLFADTQPERLPLNDSFPAHPPELVREMVIVSHFDLKRVRELVEGRPALARAAMDWGFGDWEDALGAASHMGNRAIAEYLIEKGARPSLFSAAMLGQLDVVKALVGAQPGVQRIRGPHSISLLDHARKGGQQARAVFDYLQSLGDAGAGPEAPLAEQERAKLLGAYPFGMAPSQQIDVTIENGAGLHNQLTWTRKGTMGRPLYYLGDNVFYPAGAAAVQIRFASDEKGVLMTVNDAGVVLTARKRQAQS
jgi:hypothetical protein